MSKQNEIPVWDIFIRFFHWALVLSFVLAFVTEDELLGLHTFAGYSVLFLIGIRLIWGFIGTRYARFSDFVKRPGEIKQYLKQLMALRPRRYIGHNPAGGAMIVVMLVALLLTAFTGLVTYAVEEGAGPLSAWISKGAMGGEAMEEVHEFFANFTLFLVFLHIGGVLLESLLHRENLIKAMFTGKKKQYIE